MDFSALCFGTLSLVLVSLCSLYNKTPISTKPNTQTQKENHSLNWFWSRRMDLAAITVLCIISFSALVTPCASLQSSLGQASSEPQKLLSVPTVLPRKLKLFEEVKVDEHELAQDSSTANNKQREGNISGKAYEREENVVHGRKGTRQEWVESSDTSEYYTMDYSHVRRRRPIHNKSLRP